MAILVKEGLTYNRWRDGYIYKKNKLNKFFIDLLTKSNKHITIGSM